MYTVNSGKRLLKTAMFLALILAVFASACGSGGESTAINLEETELAETTTTSTTYQLPPGWIQEGQTTTTLEGLTLDQLLVATTIPLEIQQPFGPVPDWIDPRLHHLWHRHGPGPEGCDPNAPNWAREACYQYTIGPGEPDPPSGVDVPWPYSLPDENGKVNGYWIKEGICPYFREDPTWVNEGLVPYFGRDSLNNTNGNYNEFYYHPILESTAESLPYAIKWASIMAALAIADNSFHDFLNPPQSNWEGCLKYYSTLPYSAATQERRIAPSVRSISEPSIYRLITKSEAVGQYVYVYAVSNKRYYNSLTFRCERFSHGVGQYHNAKYVGDSERWGSEIVYLARFIFVDGRLRASGVPAIPYSSIPRTDKSCDDEIKSYAPYIDEYIDKNSDIYDTWHHVGRWFYITSAATEEMRRHTYGELSEAVSCLIGLEPVDLFIPLFADLDPASLAYDPITQDKYARYSTCKEIRESGEYDAILAIAPWAETREELEPVQLAHLDSLGIELGELQDPPAGIDPADFEYPQ